MNRDDESKSGCSPLGGATSYFFQNPNARPETSARYSGAG
jgi:hypothetical protein